MKPHDYYYPDDFCGVCNNEIDYSTCYCCTICWKIICPKCMFIFNENTLYTLCLNNKCKYIHQILHTKFQADIAENIASHHPNMII
jgi:hypothetical protein